MKTLLTEQERIVIPHFDEIWNVVQQYITKRMSEINPRQSDKVKRWQLSIPNIKGPQNAFFTYIAYNLDLYVTDDKSEYDNMDSSFNESEINPYIQLAQNKKLGTIRMRSRVFTHKDFMFKDIKEEFHHELTHAYEYYITQKNGKQYYEVNSDSSFDNRSLSSILTNQRMSPLEKNLALMIYYFDPREYNSRMNSFYEEASYAVKNGNKDINQIINNSKSWKRIVIMHDVIYYMNQVTNPNDQMKLIAVANVMNRSSSKYTNYITLFQDIEYKFNELKNNTYRDYQRIVQQLLN